MSDNDSFEGLRQDILGLCASLPGQAAVLIEDLDTGERISFREEEQFPSASLIKLPILVRLFQMAGADGAERAGAAETADGRKVDLKERVTLTKDCRVDGFGILKDLEDGLSPTWRDLAVLMIVLSDNIATNLLIGRLGMDDIQQSIKESGLTATCLQRRMMDAEAKKKGLDNYTSARDVGIILKRMEQDSSKEMLSILLRQQCNQKLPALVGEDVKMAHKTGDLPGIEHDAGIIYIGTHRILAVVLTRELKDNLDGIRLNQQIGRLIEEHYKSL